MSDKKKGVCASCNDLVPNLGEDGLCAECRAVRKQEEEDAGKCRICSTDSNEKGEPQCTCMQRHAEYYAESEDISYSTASMIADMRVRLDNIENSLDAVMHVAYGGYD